MASTAQLQRGNGGDGGDRATSAHDDDDDTTSDTLPHRVYLAVGSNLGHCHDNIHRALKLLCHDNTTTRLIRTSFLHKTAPMYVTDQPAFLNGAVQLATTLSPHALLDKCKDVEATLGRDFGAIRNGPRPIDLDILLYETRHDDDDNPSSLRPVTVESHNLTIPHPGIARRPFVLQPLLEVAGPSLVHPTLNATIGQLHGRLRQQQDDDDAVVRVLPLPRNRFLYWNRTLVMGVLNVTPDSFSDGGQLLQHDDNTDDDFVEAAAQRALRMHHDDGATVIDVGGESTRPGSDEISVHEELRRVVPVLRRIRELSSNDVILSVDTRRAVVAQAAVEAGADIVNDVSGGTADPDMLSTVAALGVPMVLMHMRGTPQTMTKLTAYNDVVEEVAAALAKTSQTAEDAGIPRWLQLVDPGIGFAKDAKGNLSLLRHLRRLRDATGDLPLLIGTSRKRFLGTLTGVTDPAERDYATVASCVAALCLECDDDSGGGRPATMLRVHNVAAMVQGVKVMEAIRNERSTRKEEKK